MLEHILEGLVKAGWVLIPLILSSCLGWFIVAHRFLALNRLELHGIGSWRQSILSPEWERRLGQLTTRDRETVAGGALSAIYAVHNRGRAAMEATLDEIMKFKIPELERSLSTLAILASAAPL